jgi:hypothetical protein
MLDSTNVQGKRPALAAMVVIFVLVASGTAFALSGASALVSTGDGGAATGRAAQQPLGTLSATPPAPNSGAGGLERQGNTPAGTKGVAVKGAESPAANTVVPASGSGSGNSASLPFSGLLAIPVLLAGAALLIVGVATRRRVAGPTAA